MSEEKEQFTLRVPVELANKLREVAMALDVSTTKVIIAVLKKALKIK